MRIRLTATGAIRIIANGTMRVISDSALRGRLSAINITGMRAIRELTPRRTVRIHE